VGLRHLILLTQVKCFGSTRKASGSGGRPRINPPPLPVATPTSLAFVDQQPEVWCFATSGSGACAWSGRLEVEG
jgi:hypothetical protein